MKFSNLVSVVRQRILFPPVSDDPETQNQAQNQGQNQGDNAVHDSDEDSDSEAEENSETQKAVSSISVRVLDESNQTVEVVNMNV